MIFFNTRCSGLFTIILVDFAVVTIPDKLRYFHQLFVHTFKSKNMALLPNLELQKVASTTCADAVSGIAKQEESLPSSQPSFLTRVY